MHAGADPHLDDFATGRLVSLQNLAVSTSNLTSRGSPFYYAWNAIFSESAERSVLEALQELFPDKNGGLEDRGFTRFHKVVLGITSASLEQEINVDVSEIDSVDSDGWTALMWAARRGDFVAVDILIKAGADVNKVNDYGSLVLFYALRLINLNGLRALLEAGANAAVLNRGGKNILYYVVECQNERDIVKLLIEAGVKVNQKDVYGGTSLSYTTASSNTIIAEALLDYGADIDAYDSDGDNALY